MSDECECGEGQDTSGMSYQLQVRRAQLEHREIYINGDIDNKVIENVVVSIQNINKYDDTNESELKSAGLSGYGREPITIFINSPGGDAYDSFSVISAIRASKTKVITVALGKAMSGGFLILLAGDERYAQLYSTQMYHELSSGTGGKASDVREYSDHLDIMQRMIKMYVIEHSAITEEQLDDCHLRKSDWYMDTDDALEFGVIDGIWPPDVYEMVDGDPDCDLDDGCREGAV
jgi:ATP-dependent Clp protease protease subunit